jgi:hypothetical protein
LIYQHLSDDYFNIRAIKSNYEKVLVISNDHKNVVKSQRLQALWHNRLFEFTK